MEEAKVKDFSCTTYGEVKLQGGELITFRCRSEDVRKIKEFMLENIYSLGFSSTSDLQVEHGGYVRYSRYKIKKLRYAGGEGGYVEAIEIANPPEGRCGVVIHEYAFHDGSSFTEWETVALAHKAFEQTWGSLPSERKKLPGFKREVMCGPLSPWFYAVGDQALIGDFAVPENVQDDPVYSLGKKFIVYDDDGIPCIKTCVGTRYSEDDKKRTIYWDDGGKWSERYNENLPCPLEGNELWITEAITQFKKFLAGNITEFTINFIDGEKFVGSLALPKPKKFSPEGDYFLNVKIKGGKVLKGWVKDFKPSKKSPDIVSYVTQHMNKEIKCITITKQRTKKGGRKWPGVFFNRKMK